MNRRNLSFIFLLACLLIVFHICDIGDLSDTIHYADLQMAEAPAAEEILDNFKSFLQEGVKDLKSTVKAIIFLNAIA